MSDIRPEFRTHNLNADGQTALLEMRIAFSTLLDRLDGFLPPSRERSLTITALQEASMFASRAVAVSPMYQATNPVPEAT